MATFAELAGTTPPGNIDSFSIVPTLLRSQNHAGRAVANVGRPQGQHRVLYFEFHENGFSQAVILDGKWKGIRLKRVDAPIQIYDLQLDPAEKRDVADSNPSVVKHVELLFRSERTESTLWPIKEPPVEPRQNQAARNRTNS